MKELIEKLKDAKESTEFTETDDWFVSLNRKEIAFLLSSLQPKGKTKEEVYAEWKAKYIAEFGWKWSDKGPSGDEVFDFFWKHLESYANQQPEAMKEGWVSVEDDLPEIEQEVLVLDSKFGKIDHNSAVCIGYIAKETNTWSIYVDTGIMDNYERDNCNYQYITHWMPLPNPPKK